MVGPGKDHELMLSIHKDLFYVKGFVCPFFVRVSKVLRNHVSHHFDEHEKSIKFVLLCRKCLTLHVKFLNFSNYKLRNVSNYFVV